MARDILDPGPPVVALCGSEGAADAVAELLHHLPDDTGFSFLLIGVSQDLRRATGMDVVPAQDGMVLAPNRLHCVPAHMTARLSQTRLRMHPMPNGGTTRLDDLLESLAVAKGERSVGVVLSGTGLDGAEGVRNLKEQGGIVLAQEPASARQAGLPEAAIATGAVDFVRPPQGLAQELARLASHPFVGDPERATLPEDAQEFAEILARLEGMTGVDFRSYKPTTLRRRIRRRMVLHHVEGLSEYVHLLDERPGEAAELYADLLIQVTALFRDPELYQSLAARVLPRLFEGRGAAEPVRVWVPACSSGEEAYSLATLLCEEQRRRGSRNPLQVFATDVSQAAIDRARQGWFPRSVERTVSADLLERYFRRGDNGFLISKDVRSLCVFARQDVTRDPPFSRLDLISCRNLLIYLTGPVQQRVLRLFHRSLRADGFLVLGRAEAVGRSGGGLFSLVDRANKIYVRKPVATSTRAPERALQVAAVADESPAAGRSRGKPQDLYRQADQVLLARFGPPGVLVDDGMEILQFRGRTGRYLEPPSGTATQNLLKMARKGLLVHLRAAVQQARSSGAPVRRQGVELEADWGQVPVDVEVLPLSPGEAGERFFLVLFDESPYRDREAAEPAPETPSAEAVRMREELAATREYLNSIIEEREAANEELTAASEGFQSANEELQSANEELETAKEELQATNEELTTLNEELHDRNLELTRVNNDLKNLLATFSIPVLILGPDLTIRRFTPMVERLMNLISSDVGRPVGQIRSNLDIPDLEERVTEVVETLVPHDFEARDLEGRWYSVRIRPYRTTENLVEGAILVFVDIDAMKRALDEARVASLVTGGILDTVAQPLLVLDHRLQISRANPAFYSAFRLDPERTDGKPVVEVLGSADLHQALTELVQRERWDDIPLEVPLDDGQVRRLHFRGRRIDAGEYRLVLAVEGPESAG